MSEENILVVPRRLFDEIGSFQGFLNEADLYLTQFFEPGNHFFVPRSDAESDPSLKQLIPYCVFLSNGKILRYTRGGSSGEKRLAAKVSIGIGGHVNDEDSGSSASFGQSGYDAALAREISEELHFVGTYTNRVVGLLNDDSNEVGKVHLGVVHLISLDTESVKPGETAIVDPEFLSIDQILSDGDSLETWSLISARAIRSLGIA